MWVKYQNLLINTALTPVIVVMDRTIRFQRTIGPDSAYVRLEFADIATANTIHKQLSSNITIDKIMYLSKEGIEYTNSK